MNIIPHYAIDVSAPAAYWKAVGYAFYSDTTEIAPDGRFDPLVIAGINATGAKDERAVAWAVAERQRQLEQARSAHAAQEETKAIRELAYAIQQANEGAVLDQIIGQLSERTQFAVRKQLGR